MRHAVLITIALSLAACTTRDPVPEHRRPPDPVVQAPTPEHPQTSVQRIDVDVENADLTDVMESIGRRVGRNILVEPKVKETVTVSLRDIPWTEAVDVIARMTRCEVERRVGGILLLTQPASISMCLLNCEVRTALSMIAEQGGIEVLLHPAVQGHVTMELTDRSCLAALQDVASAAGDFAVLEEGGGLLVRVVPAR